MNWCGCSNYFASGYYNRVNAFVCASEKAAIETGLRVIRQVEKQIGPAFFEHFTGQPGLNAALTKQERRLHE
jgi:uncharacterized protein